jgi:hypothetical protein
LTESFIGPKQKEGWKDFVAVFVKDAAFVSKYTKRICDVSTVFNAFSLGPGGARDLREYSEPKKKRFKLKNLLPLVKP